MANSDKNIVITPNIGQVATPAIVFTGGSNTPSTLTINDNGSLTYNNLITTTSLTVSNTITGSVSGNAATASSAGFITNTNIGRTGSNGFISTTGWTSQSWADQPVSGLGMTVNNTPGAPTTNYGFFNKFGNRDAGGPGWGGMWMEYDGGSLHYGATILSSSNATWKRVLDSSNFNTYAPTLTGTGTSGTWPISISGTATTATTANALNTSNSYTGVNFTATGSLIVGTSGSYVAGSLYSDVNWGMIFRAKQASPVQAQFMWANSAGTELFRFNGTALTTGVTGNAATATTATNQSGGTVSATSITTSGSITATGGNNYSYTLHHGNYERLVLPAANNGAGNGEAGLYLWISEPAVTWTAAGIGRNRRNSTTGFPRINTALSANMIRFLENDGLEFSGITSAGVAYTHANMTGSNLSVYGDVTAYASDKRLKVNHKPIENSLEKVLSLSGVYFDWVDNIEELGFHPKRKHNDTGLFAQDVQAVLPQAIEPAPFDQELDPETQAYKSKSGEDYLTVNYSKLVPLLVEAIKELQIQITKQAEMINELKAGALNGKQ